MHDIYVLIWFISFRNGHIAPEAVQLPQDAYLHFHQLMVQAIAVQIVEALLQIAFYVLAGVAVLQVGYHHFSGEVGAQLLVDCCLGQQLVDGWVVGDGHGEDEGLLEEGIFAEDWGYLF